MDSSLLPFFNPRGIVIIGASTSPEKLGYGAARNLAASGYTGAIHFVGQNPGQLFGRPVYNNISQIPDPVDLAVIIVPAQDMQETIQACGERGIKAGIIISSGFREVGVQGAALEAQCLQTARTYAMRLIGPNCIGILDTHLPLDTTFLQLPMPAAGNIGFISQSGAFCAAIIDLMRGQGFGFSQIVSLGNQADINETDVLPAVAIQEHTRVIVLYMESVSDGRRFIEVARNVTRHKPVIALKVGRSNSGRQAAASHTGALAGSDEAFNAAFEKAGILRADTAEQMFDWARALADCPLPHGRRMAILTNAGGPGVIAADALEENGLIVAPLSGATRQTLAAYLPPAANIHNPIDMLASASPEVYAACLKCLLSDPNVDGVILILPPPPMFTAESVALALIPIIHKADKPVAISLMGSLLTRNALQAFDSAHIPTYPFPERAASALAALARRAEYLTTDTETQKVFKTPDHRAPVVNPSPSELVSAYGIQVPPGRLARDEKEAAFIAKEIGYPVVMKIASPDILHKSDVGGVLLDLNDQPAIRSGFRQIIEKVKTAEPRARIEGVYIQRQIVRGQEVIIGMVRDPLFGPVVMFGSGGIEVEGLKDVVFGIAPLNKTEAQAMLQKTWAGRKLKGYRNLPPVDGQAVISALVDLSWLACENEEIEEIEINPLVVLEQGAIALDVRIKRMTD